MLKTILRLSFLVCFLVFSLICCYPFLAQCKTQKATFEIIETEDGLIPFQNNLPYPSFEMQERLIISLNKYWKFKNVNMNHDLSLEERTEETIKELEQEAKSCYKKNYNDSSWKEVKIPSVNNPFPCRYQDGTWYRTEFKINSAYKNKLIRLFFHGANYVTDVWINGKWIGTHEGGYTPFVFNITKYISWNKENSIAVRVDNIPWLKDNDFDFKSNKRNIVPYKKADWWNYGGLNRDVYIEISEKVYIVRSDVRSEPSGKKNAKCKISVYVHNTENKKNPVKASVKIYNTIINNKNILSPNASDIADFKQRLKINKNKAVKSIEVYPGKVSVINYEFKLNNVKYWTPDNPQLYVLEVLLKKKNKTIDIIDKFYTQFGIRKIEKHENSEGFKLNSKKIFFKGVARHEDYMETGKALSFNNAARILKDLQVIKDMNANFLRTAHYPNHPLTYILADRIGLAIMEEIPVFWFGGLEFDLQREERGVARAMWLEMIYRDYNRASILFWSTCNECGWQDARRKFIWDLKKSVNKIDGTRLVGQSAAGHDTRDGSHRDCDYIGATMYYGVFGEKGIAYKGTKNAVDDFIHYYSHKPFIATEYGIWSYDSFLNVDEQVEIATNTFKAFKEFPQVGGVVWWCAFDWHTMLGYPYQSMGTISLDRKFLKPVYFTLQKLYSKSMHDINVNIKNIKDGDIIRGTIKALIFISDPGKSIKKVYYKFFNTDFILMERGNKFYKLRYNTKKLPEGKTYLIIKIKYKNNDCLYVKRDIVIDNIDEPPVFQNDLVDGKVYSDKLFLNIEAKDDRRISSVQYKIDNKKLIKIPEKSKDVYITTVSLKRFKNNSLHKISIHVKDNGNHLVKKEYKFSIDRSSGINVILPYNLDRISYNHNRKDAYEWSLPAEELPDSNSWFVSSSKGNVKFYLGPKEDGKNNMIESLGQILKVKPGQYKNIQFLGYTFWGNQENDLILIYSDGTKEVKQISFSDWLGANTSIEEEHIGILCSHYHYHEGDGNQKVAVYHRSVDCNPDKVLVKIKLPYDNHKHILAISLEE